MVISTSNVVEILTVRGETRDTLLISRSRRPEVEVGWAQPPPIFGRCLLWPSGWMDHDATYEVGLGPGDIVLDGDPGPPSKRDTAPPPIFGRCLGLLWPNDCMHQDTI